MIVIPFDLPDLKEPIWDNVEVGEEFGPLDIMISGHDVNSYSYAIDDYNPWYLDDSPFGGKIAPDALIARALLDLMNLKYDATRLRAIHVREEVELSGPIKVGQRLTVRSRVTDKFLKRGEPCIEVEAQACDDNGKTLIRAKQTELFRGDGRVPVSRRTAGPNSHDVISAVAEASPTAPGTSRRLDIGAVLPALIKKVSIEQMYVFSFGVPNIHTDRAIVQEMGLLAPIAQGLMSTGYLSQLLVNFFGADWFESGWTSHAFVNLVSAGDTLTVQGKIQESRVEAHATRLVLEVWCRNQEGQWTTVGSASALISR